MSDFGKKPPFIITMVNRYGIPVCVVVSVLVVLAMLLPLLILGDLLVHGQVYMGSIISGLINAAIITPIFIYFFLRVLNELSITKEKLHNLVVKDELTGVHNRRYFVDRLSQAFAYARRHNSTFGLLFMDIDRFKSINDTYGHNAGDEVIIQVAHLCQSMLRETDVFARLGGEEFVCLIHDIDAVDIEYLAHRINKAVAVMQIEYQQHTIPVTISIGVAKLDNSHQKEEDLILSVDDALYKAKRNGRNCVFVN